MQLDALERGGVKPSLFSRARWLALLALAVVVLASIPTALLVMRLDAGLRAPSVALPPIVSDVKPPAIPLPAQQPAIQTPAAQPSTAPVQKAPAVPIHSLSPQHDAGYLRSPAITHAAAVRARSVPVAHSAVHAAPVRHVAMARMHYRLKVPALGIDLKIVEGDGSDNIPDWVANHYPGTAAPGKPGNSYLYAHGLRGMFYAIRLAKLGMAVYITDTDTGKTQTFHVKRIIGLVPYNATWVITQRSAGPMLTLQTCIDYNPKGPKYVVVAS